jgi:DNA-binding ferritin-like protein
MIFKTKKQLQKHFDKLDEMEEQRRKLLQEQYTLRSTIEILEKYPEVIFEDSPDNIRELIDHLEAKHEQLTEEIREKFGIANGDVANTEGLRKVIMGLVK